MKIAYLILAHNNPVHLNKLIDELYDEKNADIFIHLDKKSRTKFKDIDFSKVKMLEKNVNVYWGEYSLVEATLLLLKEAYEHAHYDYFVLLSGVDYPVKNKKYIYYFFNKYNGCQFIDLCEMPLFDKSLDRLDYFRVHSRNIKFYNYFVQIINHHIKKIGLKRNYPKEMNDWKLYAGANWWALNNDCVAFILKFIATHPNFVKYFKNTFIPDEMFFQMIIGNSKFKNKIMNCLTYADWSSNPKPNIINTSHMRIFDRPYLNVTFGDKKKYVLFARKFNDKSNEIVKMIKKRYL